MASVDPDDRMALDSEDRMPKVVQFECGLCEGINSLLALIKRMESAGVQQAPGWR